MPTDLRVSVRRQFDRLRKELAVATGYVAALQDERSRDTNWPMTCWMDERRGNGLSRVLLACSGACGAGR